MLGSQHSAGEASRSRILGSEIAGLKTLISATQLLGGLEQDSVLLRLPFLR